MAAAAGDGVLHGEQLLLRDHENHIDRLELRDDEDAELIRGVQDVADVDQTNADASVDRRGIVAIAEGGSRAVDEPVGAHQRLELRHQRLLRRMNCC
ncbi:hypothetical protein [Methylocystis parvus]|uniref:hypothetical protein n=1 Tax=Methylocystis parvus TaxID=134 RepID=UPI003C726053